MPNECLEGSATAFTRMKCFLYFSSFVFFQSVRAIRKFFYEYFCRLSNTPPTHVSGRLSSSFARRERYRALVKRRNFFRRVPLLTAGDQLSMRFIRKKSLKLLKFSTFRTLGMPMPAAKQSNSVGVSFRCAISPPTFLQLAWYSVNKFRFSCLNHCSRKLFSNLALVGFWLGLARHQPRIGNAAAVISAAPNCATGRWENV